MKTKTKEGARNKGNPYFLRVPWNKGGLVNTGLLFSASSLRLFWTSSYILDSLQSLSGGGRLYIEPEVEATPVSKR